MGAGTGYVKERSFNICSLHLIQFIIFWIVPVPKIQLRFLCIYFSVLYERLGVLNSQRLGWHFSTEDLYKLGSEQTVHFSSGCSLVYLANWQASSNSLWYSDRWNWPFWKSFPSSGFFVGSWSWIDLEKMIGFILCGRNNDFQAGDISEIDFTLLYGTNVVRWEKIQKKYLGVLISLYPRLPRSRCAFRSTAKKRRERNFA